MNINTATQHQGVIAWDGAASYPIDIRQHVSFSFTFKATADLPVDAVFHVQAAPPNSADPCTPGAFVDVPEVLTCVAPYGAAGATQSGFTIPAGTKKGSICTATLPCRPDAFIQLVATAGGAAVEAVAVLSGPR
ncbi:hypothetical protein CQ14_06790 [Bradyrhizobium lablabi]|uniref:Uncharacterized protein n=1 Tax=Bradyrhizobium lablabi TaxID=722472 RepID=A0A0R3MVR1_9BRAD|nr:hypothetical protein [Bradyrhizobium lablabi]KRR21350.1 hypothetical protein CQ14_06790 [Bradyrhizobium lablabi]